MMGLLDYCFSVSLEDWWSEDREWQLTGDVEDSMLDDEEEDTK